MHDEEPEDLDEEFEEEDPGVDPALARAAAEVLGRVSRGQARGLSFEQAVVLLLERVGNLDRDRLEGISLATGDWYHELDDPDDLRRRERTWMLWCCEQLASCAVAALTLALVVTLQLDEHDRGRGGEQAALEEVKVMLNDELAMARGWLVDEGEAPTRRRVDELLGLIVISAVATDAAGAASEWTGRFPGTAACRAAESAASLIVSAHELVTALDEEWPPVRELW